MSDATLGRYEILGELGRGAMGTVYKARDPIIDRVVALKTISTTLTGEAFRRFEESFFREARSAGRLNHPNIVTIYDAGEASGQAYIAMEFLDGTSLRETLDGEKRPFSPTRALEMAAQVARALAYAHEKGVVHRDIKPANIIVVRNRRPKLTDFGIARLMDGGGSNTDLAGSPKYMSPEQIRGETIDGRSDVFSLGTVFYEMLTGVAPFEAETVPAIMRKVLDEMPAPPSALVPGIPPELDGVVLRMLAKRPEDRFPSARALFRELRRLYEKLDPKSETIAELAADLRAEPKPALSDPDAPTVILGEEKPASTPRGLPRVALLAGVAAAVVIALALGLRDRPTDEPPRAIAPQPAVVTSAPARTVVPPPQPVTEALELPRSEPVATEAAPPLPKKAPAAKPAAKPARKKPEPAGVASAPPAPAPEPVVEAPKPTGTVVLAVSPWGELFVNGEARGTSPPVTSLMLPAGRHRIEIRNTTLAPYAADITVEPGETRRIRHRFE